MYQVPFVKMPSNPATYQKQPYHPKKSAPTGPSCPTAADILIMLGGTHRVIGELAQAVSGKVEMQSYMLGMRAYRQST